MVRSVLIRKMLGSYIWLKPVRHNRECHVHICTRIMYVCLQEHLDLFFQDSLTAEQVNGSYKAPSQSYQVHEGTSGQIFRRFFIFADSAKQQT